MLLVIAEFGKVGHGMAEQYIHVDDVGTIFRLTLMQSETEIFDVSAASVFFIFLSPSGRRYEVDADYVTDGTDGKVQYVSVAGNIDEVGRWQYQARVEADTHQWSSEIIVFKVKKNL